MTEPLALLALLALPAIAALHLFRRAARQRAVSALFLWEDPERITPAGRRREPLRANVSLLLELLAAAALALALAGPRSCAEAAAPHLVAILDDSASMSAGSGGESAAERARRELLRRLESAERGTRVTLIASGTPPRILCGPEAGLDEARAALAGYAPASADHSLEPALALARGLWSDAELLVLSDHAEALDSADVAEFLALGKPRENWALTSARRAALAAGSSRERATVEVASFATRVARSVVRLERASDGSPLAERALELDPGASVSVEIEVAAEPGDWRVILGSAESDALGLDDELCLPAPHARDVRLHLAAPGEDLRALRLEREDGSRFDPRGLGAAEGWASTPAASELHLGRAPVPDAVRAALIWRAPEGEASAFASPFLIERAHPLLRGLELAGLVWSAESSWTPPGRALVRAGACVLLSEERGDERVVWHLNLAPASSTLGASPDWPVLLANAIEARRAELPGPRESLVALGRAPRAFGSPRARYELRELATEVRVVCTASPSGALPLPALARAGLYELARLDAADPASREERWSLAAALLDPRESDLRRCSSAQRSGVRERAARARERSEESSTATRRSLGACAVVLLALDWLWLARRGRARVAAPTRGGGR